MRKHGWLVLVVTALVVGAAAYAWAFPVVSKDTKLACGSCHAQATGGPLSDAGKAWKADHTKMPAAAAKTAAYVGSNKCKMCHLPVFKSWQETPHAKAYTGLVAADAKATAEVAAKLKLDVKGKGVDNAACVQCHVVGLGLAGGFAMGDSTKVASFGAVGCETCHGPGSLHVAAPKEEKAKAITRVVSEVYCRHCHTAEMSPNFKFDEYKAKGLHAVAAK